MAPQLDVTWSRLPGYPRCAQHSADLASTPVDKRFRETTAAPWTGSKYCSCTGWRTDAISGVPKILGEEA